MHLLLHKQEAHTLVMGKYKEVAEGSVFLEGCNSDFHSNFHVSLFFILNKMCFEASVAHVHGLITAVHMESLSKRTNWYTGLGILHFLSNQAMSRPFFGQHEQYDSSSACTLK